MDQNSGDFAYNMRSSFGLEGRAIEGEAGPRLHYAGAALAKANRRAAGLPAIGAEDHLVAIRQKGTGFPGGERYLPLAVGAQLHQAAIALRRRPGDRAGAE